MERVQLGIHQLAFPSGRISAGTSRPRITVEDDPGGEPDRELLDLEAGARGEHEEGEHQDQRRTRDGTTSERAAAGTERRPCVCAVRAGVQTEILG